MVFLKEALHNYFIAYHGKNIALHNQYSVPEICNSFKFLHCDCLYFLWHGVKGNNKTGVVS